MQSSIKSFFSKTPAASGGVSKPSAKRTSALSAVAAAELRKHGASTSPSSTPLPSPSKKKPSQLGTADPLSPSVRAKIEGNRASARVKRLQASGVDVTSVSGITQLLEPSWRTSLTSTLSEKYFEQLVNFVRSERQAHVIYPAPHDVFSAFNHSTFSRTRVVIIGQDPYHGPGQAHGMSFSVPPGMFQPPSLVNIFRELENDVTGFVKPMNKKGCLDKWANQGVLLLNSVLTVRRGSPGSHQARGWERFTDAVVHALNHRKAQDTDVGNGGVVFMLWGGYAKKKGAGINRKKHLCLTAVHPSPLSANRGGWFGNKHFSKANEFLAKNGQTPIDWKLD